MSVGCGMERGDGAEYGWETVPAILVREGKNLETRTRLVAVESEKWADLRTHYCLGREARKSLGEQPGVWPSALGP